MDVAAVTPSSVRDIFKTDRTASVEVIHTANALLVGLAPGVASYVPYASVFQELRAGESWSNVDFNQLWECSNLPSFSCTASARVIGKERVTVRAGSFEAWKIVVDLRIRGAALEGT